MSAFGVGLTGGAGSGKSTIAAMLAGHGAAVVDADAIAHELTGAGGAALSAVRDAFGAEAIAADGALDRARMRARVFVDATARTLLESLLHPMIRVAMRERAAQLSPEGAPYLVFVVPLLVETDPARDYVDRILLVDCSESTQLARVSARTGIDHQTARNIIAVQATRARRLAAADDVLVNETSLAEVAPRVQQLHREYLRSAAIKRSRETL